MTDFQPLLPHELLSSRSQLPDQSVARTVEPNLLNELFPAIGHAPNFKSALADLVRLVCTHTRWAFGEVWLPTPPGYMTHSGIWYAAQASLESFGRASLDWQFSRNEGLPGCVWERGDVVWLPDIAASLEPHFQRRDMILAHGLKAGIGLPITTPDQHLLAVMVFFMDEVYDGEPAQLGVIKTIAAQLGIVLYLKQTETSLLSHQQRLQRLVNTLPGIVFTAKGPPDWTMRSLSHGCARLTGYTEAELANDTGPVSYNDITHPDDLSNVLRQIQTALSIGQTYDVEYRIITRSGEEKWVWEKGRGVLGPSGEICGLEGLITDITPLKQTEAALRQSETRYRLLAERSQDLISQHDPKGVFQYVSPACRALLGYEPAELLGKSARQLLHPDDEVRAVDYFRQFLRHRTGKILRFRVRHRNDTYLWFETISCVVDQPTGLSGQQVIAVSRDVTERVRTEQELINRERFLRLVLDSIPQHLFWKDVHGVYRGCNRAFSESFGLSNPTDIIGKTDFDLTHYSTEDAAHFFQQEQQVIQRDQPSLDTLEPRRTQPPGWLSVSKFPIHDANDSIVGVLGTLEDVTERIEFQRALARREQYLTALVELQRHLLSFDDTWDNDHFCRALEPLGTATEADRVYIYRIRAELPELLVQQAQWVSHGTVQTLGHPSVAAYALDGPIRPWITELSHGKCINQTLDQFPLALQKQIGEPPIGVKSVLLLPLWVRGKFSGIVGFSNCRIQQIWNRSEVALLQVAVNLIAIAIERYQTEICLRKTEGKYRSIFENAVEGIFQSTTTGQFLTANPMLAKIYGYDSPEELIQTVTDIERQLYVDVDRRDEFIKHMLTNGSVIGFESAMYRKDGRIIWISESARTVYDENRNIIGFEGTVKDITERKRSERELHQRDRLLEGVAQVSRHLLTTPDLTTSLPKALSILGMATDADRVYIYENHPHSETGEPAMSMRYEWTQTAIAPSIDQPHWQNQSYREHGLERWFRAFQAGCSIRGLVDTFPPSEQALLLRDNIQSILMVPIFIDQELWGYIGFDACREARHWSLGEESILVTVAAGIGGVLERQHADNQMRHQAFHDPLTGLPNRVAFNRHLPIVISASLRAKTLMAVLFLDLDRFKNINDTLGHAVGDKLLVQATQRLISCLRKCDILARWGGDEFTLILPNIASELEAEAVARRLSDSLKPPFFIEGQELYITSSIGIALCPDNADDMTTLLQNADAAMYSAKADGRNTYRFYTSTLNSNASRQLTLEKYLHQALRKQEFRLFFQPQINLDEGKICHMEALIRWYSPELGWVAPVDFIPVAEEIGLVVELGDWVLKQACYQLQTWHQQGFDSLKVAVNLSARQLQHTSLVQTIQQVLDAFELLPKDLELEITETAALSNLDASIVTLNQLRQLGTRIVMDDFGTGYSSLNYLKRLPFQRLKIDRSFVEDIPADAQDIAMLRAIIALGQELHLEIVAEGVETQEQMICLKELGCNNMQGYWFCSPRDAEATTHFLERHWPTYTGDGNH